MKDLFSYNVTLWIRLKIPDGPGYSEKFYFSPGDTGFQCYDTAFGRIGVAICWDQVRYVVDVLFSLLTGRMLHSGFLRPLGRWH